MITISGILFAGLLAGMVITETIFDRKGIGWWMARAALQLDVPAIMFNVLFLGIVFVVVNLDRGPDLRQGRPAHPAVLRKDCPAMRSELAQDRSRPPRRTRGCGSSPFP